MVRRIQEARRRHSPWLYLPVVIAAAIALVVVAVGSATNPTTHPAYSTFTHQSDELGANDVPGQKDLTEQGTNNSFEGTGDLWVYWNWDDTSVSGNNTLDGCTLFDSDGDGNANFAVCATVGKSGSSLTLKAVTVYTCGDARNDRCSSSVTAIANPGSGCLLDGPVAGPFDTSDTRIYCDVKLADVNATNSTTLLNTCSYPSSQPNSDPSDCVLVPGAVNTTTATTPSFSWSVTLKDSATVSPTASVGANGTVTFELFGPYADNTGTCASTDRIYSSGALSLSSGTTSTDNATSATGSNVVSTAGYYKWKATYSGATGINGSNSGCGELQHVTAATVSST